MTCKSIMSIFKINSVICVVVALIACKNNGEDNLLVTPTELAFNAFAISEKTLSVTTNVKDWNAVPSGNWIATGKWDDKLFVSVKTNTETTGNRTGTITVTAGSADPVTVTVTQSAAPTLSASPTSLTFGANETTARIVTVTTNATTWDYTCEARWLTLEKSNNTLIVAVNEINSGAAERKASITITAGDTKAVIQVTQDYPDSEPVPGNSITIGTVNYTVDVTKVEKIEDGIWYMYAQTKNANKPLVIHTVRYTTTTPGYVIETWVGNDSISGKESPQNMVSRYERAGREVKMSVNGGFFDMAVGGTTIYMQATKGVLTFPPPPEANRPVIGFDEQNRPYMEIIHLDCKAKIEKNNKELKINTVNGIRQTNYLVLYNSYRGKHTYTNQYGIEALCAPVDGQWEELDNHVNVRCKVEKVAAQGNMEIPKGKIVLSGHGTAHEQFMNTLQTDDEVLVTADYYARSDATITSAVIRNAINGSHVILQGNTVVPVDNNGDPLLYNNHPRTAAGFSADKRYVYFTVIEGRYSASAGVRADELGQVMQYFGAANAINLDGGGSSCMMVGKQAKNLIEGGTWQRPVADGFAIIRK